MPSHFDLRRVYDSITHVLSELLPCSFYYWKTCFWIHCVPSHWSNTNLRVIFGGSASSLSLNCQIHQHPIPICSPSTGPNKIPQFSWVQMYGVFSGILMLIVFNTEKIIYSKCFLLWFSIIPLFLCAKLWKQTYEFFNSYT